MLLFCTHVAPWEAGGVAASGRRWANAARSQGIPVVWCWSGDGLLYWSATLGAIDVETTPARHDAIVRRAAELGVRAVFVHYVSQNAAWAGVVSSALDVPLVLNCRGNDVTHGVFQSDSVLEALHRIASHFVFVADHLLLLTEARFGGVRARSTVVQNWLAPEELEGLKTEQAFRPLRPPTFGLLGIWKWKKGLEVALDALLLTTPLLPRCRIYGDLTRCPPSTHEKYYKLAGRGLPSIERYEPAQLGAVYSGLDVVVIPSLVEGMPNTMMEGMGAGCAIMGSRVPGITEILSKHEVGVSFAAGDARDLARAISTLADDAEGVRKLGDEARAVARRMAGNPWMLLPSQLLFELGFFPQ